VVYHKVAQRTLLGDDTLLSWSRWLPKIYLVNAEKPIEPCQGDSSLCGSLPAPDECDRGAMKTHTFTLILSGVATITPELADALYAATRGDIELNQRDGVAFVEFERTASTLREAITVAIREVEQAEVGVRVVRVESEAANVIAKINADLLGVTSG
jgi:hypothetical protein